MLDFHLFWQKCQPGPFSFFAQTCIFYALSFKSNLMRPRRSQYIKSIQKILPFPANVQEPMAFFRPISGIFAPVNTLHFL